LIPIHLLFFLSSSSQLELPQEAISSGSPLPFFLSSSFFLHVFSVGITLDLAFSPFSLSFPPLRDRDRRGPATRGIYFSFFFPFFSFHLPFYRG